MILRLKNNPDTVNSPDTTENDIEIKLKNANEDYVSLMNAAREKHTTSLTQVYEELFKNLTSVKFLSIQSVILIQSSFYDLQNLFYHKFFKALYKIGKAYS
jgi:hypothetical protein